MSNKATSPPNVIRVHLHKVLTKSFALPRGDERHPIVDSWNIHAAPRVVLVGAGVGKSHALSQLAADWISDIITFQDRGQDWQAARLCAHEPAQLSGAPLARARYLQTVSLRRQGRSQTALANIEKLGDVDGDLRVAVRTLRIVLLYDEGHYERAIEAASAIVGHPSYDGAVASYLTAASFYALGETKSSTAAIRSYLRSPGGPKHLDVMAPAVLAAGLIDQEAADAALGVLNDIPRTRDPVSLAILETLRTHAQLLLGRREEAYRSCKRALTWNPHGKTGAHLRELLDTARLRSAAIKPNWNVEKSFPPLRGFRPARRTRPLANERDSGQPFPDNTLMRWRVNQLTGREDLPREARRELFLMVEKTLPAAPATWETQAAIQFGLDDAGKLPDKSAGDLLIFAAHLLADEVAKPVGRHTNQLWEALFHWIVPKFAELDWGSLGTLPQFEPTKKVSLSYLDSTMALYVVAATQLATWGRHGEAHSILRDAQEKLCCLGIAESARATWLHLVHATVKAYAGEDPSQHIHAFNLQAAREEEPPATLLLYLLQFWPREWVPTLAISLPTLTGSRRVVMNVEGALAATAHDPEAKIADELMESISVEDRRDSEPSIERKYVELADYYDELPDGAHVIPVLNVSG